MSDLKQGFSVTSLHFIVKGIGHHGIGLRLERTASYRDKNNLVLFMKGVLPWQQKA
jgi:hypothetical protein